MRVCVCYSHSCLSMCACACVIYILVYESVNQTCLLCTRTCISIIILKCLALTLSTFSTFQTSRRIAGQRYPVARASRAVQRNVLPRRPSEPAHIAFLLQRPGLGRQPLAMEKGHGYAYSGRVCAQSNSFPEGDLWVFYGKDTHPGMT